MSDFKKVVTENKSLFNYEVIQAFNDISYNGVLTLKDLVSSKEVVIKDAYKFKEVENTVVEEPVTINNFFFILQQNTERYLLASDMVGKLPLQVKDKEKIAWNKEGYWLIKSFSPVGFSSQKCMSFRELVDNFAFFDHSNPTQFKLWKIIALAGYLSRLNVRVATTPAFGKSGFIRLLGDLMEHVGVVQNPSLAKLEYLTHNKLVLVNEMVNLAKAEVRDIEQYLLPIGDFSNTYEKRSRASSKYGGSEKYDVSKLSLFLTYNNKDCYPDDTRYFDEAHTKQALERFLPFKFDGTLTHKFTKELTPKLLAQQHRDLYVALARTIKFYTDEMNVKKELKPFSALELENDFKDRWRINFTTILKFINLYSNDEKEYKRLVSTLYNCHVDYLSMISGNGKTLLDTFRAKEVVSDDVYVPVEELEEYVE